MILTGFNLPHYLLDKGFISYESFMDKGLTIHMASSRNTGFIVNKSEENALFVKQVRAFDQEKIETLRAEATCYWLANNEAEYGELKKFLPRFFHFDHFNYILVLEFITGSQDLQAFYSQYRYFPTEIGRQLANVLASYHKDIYRTIQKGKSAQLFRKAVPGPFLMFGDQLAYMNPRNKVEEQLHSLIRQQEGFSEKVAAIRTEWLPSSLIHGDIKPNNFLINQDCLETGHFNLRLIDWEIADLGDPAWDVAAVLQSYLLMWVMSDTGEEAVSQVNAAAFQLEDMQPGIREFWSAYCQAMGLSGAKEEVFLLKTTRFCAVKLLHTSYESSVLSGQLPPQSAKMLQLSFNLLQSPNEAIESLFAIPLNQKVVSDVP